MAVRRSRAIPIFPGPRFLPRPTPSSLIIHNSLALRASWFGCAAHHAALLDSAEPAVAVVPRASSDSVAMVVQGRGQQPPIRAGMMISPCFETTFPPSLNACGGELIDMMVI